MKKKVLAVIVFLALSVSVHAAQPLDAEQLNRLRTVRWILDEVDKRSFGEIVQDLQKTTFSEGHLQLLEAVAQTYKELLVDYQIAGLEKKKWLHGMIQLNLAYLQLGGAQQNTASALNALIQQKLLRHLPPETLSDPRLVQPLE